MSKIKKVKKISKNNNNVKSQSKAISSSLLFFV